jgi:hypothetical protein
VAIVSTTACTPGTSWLTANSPHERYGLLAATASEAAASDASASTVAVSDAVVAAVRLRVDGAAVDVSPKLQSRFDVVGPATDRVYRATYDFGDPEDESGYKVTVTLVCVRPFDHPELSASDLMQAAYQIRRRTSGSNVSRQAVFAGPDLPDGWFRIDGGQMAVNLEQRTTFAGLDLSTSVAASGLPRS